MAATLRRLPFGSCPWLLPIGLLTALLSTIDIAPTTSQLGEARLPDADGMDDELPDVRQKLADRLDRLLAGAES